MVIEKKTYEAFGRKAYLLGVGRDDGRRYWLIEPTWDCRWYWGFGYVESFTNDKRPDRSKGVESHEHFDLKFMPHGGETSFDKFKKAFKDTTLTDDEIWRLCDLMKSAYCLKEAAEIFSRGHSHYTEKAKLEALRDRALSDRINKEFMIALFNEIESIFEGKGDNGR